MNKPIIGVSGNFLIDKEMFLGYKKVYVNEDYISGVINAGGVPIVLPMTEDEEVIDRYISSIDALILTGGQDVSPEFYGEDPMPKLGVVVPRRDRFDLSLLKKAKEKNIPILGICRGVQIINVAYGGNLFQDLSYSGLNYLKHSQGHTTNLPTHRISVEEESHLYETLKENDLMVNSFHHQAIDRVGEGLRVVAKAPDGIIEAVEDRNYRFLLGVQFHPEMLHMVMESMQGIFNRLVEEAKK